MSGGAAIVLGTRPEIIKLASIIHELAAGGEPACVIHTNQHYDWALDARFFEELDLPAPDVNLNVGSGPHGAQTAKMLEAIEATLLEREPTRVIVQGDTNSGLAGALAAVKLHREVVHVEAGLRSFDRRMPEEVNRRLIDHLADHLFPPTETTRAELLGESVPGVVHEPLGNTGVDATLMYSPGHHLPAEERQRRILLTLHRPENVDDRDTLAGILAGVAEAASEAGLEVVFPIHPRTRERLGQFGLELPAPIEATDVKSFSEMLGLQATSRLVMTDSGGLQEEACVLGTPAVVLRTHTDRPETIEVGASVLAGVETAAITAAARDLLSREEFGWEQPYGDGSAGTRIIATLGDPPG